jgi:PAS domain S-box-containing protein
MPDDQEAEAGTVQQLRVLHRRITELEQAQQTLERSEKQFRELFENASVGVYRTTPDGRIIMANPALVQMLGYSSFEQLSQRNLEKEGFAPGYPRSLFKDLIEKNGRVASLDSAWLRQDGTTVSVSEDGWVVRDESGRPLYYEGVVQDITERKKAEEKLKQYQLMVESAQDAIFYKDLESRYIIANYSRFFDAVVADALYMESPFFNFCLGRGKQIIAVLKTNQAGLFEDAQGLFSDMEPKKWDRQDCSIKYWQAEGFKVETIDVPLRVLHTEETHHKRRRISGRWTKQIETQSWWWATSIPERQLSTRQLYQAGHKRWDIENGNFNTLGRDWALNHCFKHDPTAIINFLLTLFIVYVLVQSFYHRNLKPQVRAILGTLIAITDELYASLSASPSRAPLLAYLAHPPP